MDENALQRAITTLQQAKRIAILTGAGVSKESGVPTFRDAVDGLWAKYDPQELATPQAFQKNPKLVWDWYEYRREMMRPAQPNAGHYALAQLEKVRPTVLITQNIDNLHEQAGSQDVIHLHGLIAQNKCVANCRGVNTFIDVSSLTWDKADSLPKCPHCGAWVRPNVVWFGEALPADALHRAMQESRACDVMLVVGTSGIVYPAASLPSVARQASATVIEVNPEPSGITSLANIFLQGASGVVLPKLIQGLAV